MCTSFKLALIDACFGSCRILRNERGRVRELDAPPSLTVLFVLSIAPDGLVSFSGQEVVSLDLWLPKGDSDSFSSLTFSIPFPCVQTLKDLWPIPEISTRELRAYNSFFHDGCALCIAFRKESYSISASQ